MGPFCSVRGPARFPERVHHGCALEETAEESVMTYQGSTEG